MICERCGSKMKEIPNIIEEYIKLLGYMNTRVSYALEDPSEIKEYECLECGWRSPKE